MKIAIRHRWKWIWKILNKNMCIAIKTYIASKIDGTPQEFPENYACWIPIKKLIAEEKRLATTHLLDDNLRKYLYDEKVNMIFTCDSNHNVINMEVRWEYECRWYNVF